MIQQLRNRSPVRNHKSIKAPFLAQNLRHDVRIRSSRHAIERVEAAHQRSRARFDSRVVRGQIHLPQCDVAHIHRVVVAPRNRRAIRSKMLHAHRHRIRLAQVVLLIPLNPTARNRRA